MKKIGICLLGILLLISACGESGDQTGSEGTVSDNKGTQVSGEKENKPEPVSDKEQVTDREILSNFYFRFTINGDGFSNDTLVMNAIENANSITYNSDFELSRLKISSYDNKYSIRGMMFEGKVEPGTYALAEKYVYSGMVIRGKLYEMFQKNCQLTIDTIDRHAGLVRGRFSGLVANVSPETGELIEKVIITNGEFQVKLQEEKQEPDNKVDS